MDPSFVLSNGKYRINVWVPEGHDGLRELSLQTESVFAAGGGYGQYGDGEPLFGHNEQTEFGGGRGLDSFSEDTSRFFDSNGWTLTPSVAGPNPQWYYAHGYRDAIDNLPGNMSFLPLYDNNRLAAVSVVPNAAITVSTVALWIRRVGLGPGQLTVSLRADDSGAPDAAVIASATITQDDVPDVLSRLYEFDMGGQALSSATTYWLVCETSGTDSRDGHWEVGYQMLATGLSSADGLSWSQTANGLYYRAKNAARPLHYRFFELDGVLYAVSLYDTDTASTLWMNGVRGKATAGGANTLTDSNQTMPVGVFSGALLKIIRGTGAGQVAEIATNSATMFTLTANWSITPDNTSQYIVYQTPYFKEVGTTGLGRVKTLTTYSKGANGEIALFGHKVATDPIRKMRFDPTNTPPSHEFGDDGTNHADVLSTGHISGTGEVVWRALNGDGSALVSYAPTTAFSTALTFGSAVVAGHQSQPVTNIVEETNGASSRVLIFKPNEIGFVVNNGYYRLNVALDAFPESTNGQAALLHGIYAYFNYAWSMERLYETALEDVDPNRDAGLPPERQGVISAMAVHPVGVMFAIDAGKDGISSVLFFNGVGFHEVFRAPCAGQRIRSLHWQANEGGKRYLWIGVGDDIVYMAFPRMHRDPFRDPSQLYMHEWYLTTAALDMGNRGIQKIWKEISLIAKNLDGIGIKGYLDYQVDDDIGSDEWTQVDVGTFRETPRATIDFTIGDSTRIRFRIRMYTTNANVPPLVYAWVVKGSGFMPNLPSITMNAKFGSIAEVLGGSDENSLSVFRNNPAAVWTVTESIYKRAEGMQVAVRVIQTDPEFTLGDDDNVSATIQLLGLRDAS